MAKVIAPFKIVGTLDDLNFYLDENNTNLVRTKGKTGVSSEEFKNNPVFTKVRNHNKEFGRATKKAQIFRAIAHAFNNRAKDGSFAGRANKLILEIIQEDTTNANGNRTFEDGINNPNIRSYFMGFEGNKLRPLNQVLKIKGCWNEKINSYTIENLNLIADINWPEKADHVHFAIANAIWDFKKDTFETHYSQEIVIQKDENPQSLNLVTKTENTNSTKTKTETDTKTENLLNLTFLFIGFSIQERNKLKELKRANNTVSIIWSK